MRSPEYQLSVMGKTERYMLNIREPVVIFVTVTKHSLEQDCNGPQRHKRTNVLGYDGVPREQSTAYLASTCDLMGTV